MLLELLIAIGLGLAGGLTIWAITVAVRFLIIGIHAKVTDVPWWRNPWTDRLFPGSKS